MILDRVDRITMAEQHSSEGVVIIGASLAALHVATRLPESLINSTVVVDSAGCWLKEWHEQGDKLGVGHLRTPVTVHPHASPLALQTYAQKKGRLQELCPVSSRFAPVPSWSLFNDFCRARVVGRLSAALAKVVQDEVTSLHVLPDQQGVRLELSSGKSMCARAVVYTGGPTLPVIPAWARPLLLEAQEAIAKPLSPSSPQLLTWDQVDLRDSPELEGWHVVLVGGGMTAATLAVGAAGRGARVTLLCRRPLEQQPFACEVGWWGNKRLHEFLQLDPVQRLRACRRARQQGSIHALLWQQLAELAAAGRVAVVEGMEVAAAACSYSGEDEGGSAAAGIAGAGLWELSLTPSKAAGAGGAGSRGGNASAAGEGPQLTAFQVAAAAVAAAGGNTSPPAGVGPHNCPGQQEQQEKQQQGQEQLRSLQADAVWLACGSSYDCGRDPLLAQLSLQHPAPTVAGYPLVDDATLAWPGAPVFLVGRAAMLSTGPAAGDPGGMRLAAAKVAAALGRLASSEELAWVAAGRRLAGVAVDAAAAAALPKEEEGAVYEEPRPKASVAKPEHLIDVSDLDPALSRMELQHYKFTDDDFEICVILQLPEAVPLEQVRTRFGERSLEMWAVGTEAAYHLHLPKLYGRVITKKCRAKVNTKAHKVFLLLHKESDAEWRFLKS